MRAPDVLTGLSVSADLSNYRVAHLFWYKSRHDVRVPLFNLRHIS